MLLSKCLLKLLIVYYLLKVIITCVQFSPSVVSNCLWPHGLQHARLLHPWDFPGKSTAVGCHVSSANLRLLIFLPAILIPACVSSSPAFHIMYSAYKLNKQGDNIQPWRTPFPIWIQSVVPCPVLTGGADPEINGAEQKTQKRMHTNIPN